LVKQQKQGRLLTLSARVVLGAERLTQLGLTISTALVERVNLPLRQALAPLARTSHSAPLRLAIRAFSMGTCLAQ
jgi:IS1 family transposase